MNKHAIQGSKIISSLRFKWPHRPWKHHAEVQTCESLSRVWLLTASCTVAHRLLCPWDSPGKNTGVGCIFYSRGSSQHRDRTHISHISCIGRRALHHWRHLWSPRTLEWVATPSSRGSSWPRDRIQMSRIAGRFFTIWATRESPTAPYLSMNTYASVTREEIKWMSKEYLALCQAPCPHTSSLKLTMTCKKLRGVK